MKQKNENQYKINENEWLLNNINNYPIFLDSFP